MTTTITPAISLWNAAVATIVCIAVLSLLRRLLWPGRRSDVAAAAKAAQQSQQHVDTRPTLAILFGSQTGTAETFAKALAKDCERCGFRCLVQDLFSYDRELLATERAAVFAMASYGEGEPTDNARDFYEWLMSTSVSLSGLRYSVFGLGNRQYKHYQKIGRDVDSRLHVLGAERVFERGEGDADLSIEDDFEQWKSRLLPVLCEKFGTRALATGDESVATLTLRELVDNAPLRSPYPEPSFYNPASKSAPYISRCVVNQELLVSPQERHRSTRHLEFDITGADISYDAGDHLGVYPRNPKMLVEALAHRLGLDATALDKHVALVPIDNPADTRAFFPQFRTTLRRVFEWYVDISSPPKKQLLRVLAKYCGDAGEHDQLVRMSDNNTEEGRLEYRRFVLDTDRALLDVLVAFPSCKPSVAHLLENLPRLQPRFYSIASSSAVQPDRISACVSVVRYETSLGRARDGCCSSFLESLQPGDTVPIFVRKSGFHLPHDPLRPVVMIGPGTGLAPFVGFIQQRNHILETGQRMGDCHLYFGCRRKAEDYIYRNLMEESSTKGALSKVYVAFSREGQGSAKTYVQHLLLQNQAEVWRLLESNCVVFVCGDAKYMAKDVDAALLSIIQEGKKCSLEEARQHLELLEKTSRYLRDVWSP